VRLTAEIRANELERNDALDEHMPSSIDDAHSTFTKARFESIATRDDLVDEGVG
jgi:hypothetical protein